MGDILQNKAIISTFIHLNTLILDINQPVKHSCFDLTTVFFNVSVYNKYAIV